ncbi:hypothetical protein BpHYR1_053710 [Brachionus plicatilis]|uniref:Uncharacterized protein n=1 Tax=Brachionus plicatilis TaxID=10195 RepID=A0A3M7T9E6_BRAPC|nr:hypothetical protein BpHYR1_053710 [Brachionus plicatilis]
MNVYMLKRLKKKGTVDQSKDKEVDETSIDEIQECLVKLNLSLVKNINQNQFLALNELETNIKRINNQLDDFIFYKNATLNYGSIFKLLDSNMFQFDPTDLEIKEKSGLRAHLDDAKTLLANLQDQVRIEDANQLSHQLKELEQRLVTFKSECDEDKRIENIVYLIKAQNEQTSRQESDLNGYKRDLQELRLNSYKNEFAKLYEKFEKRLQILYTDDNDDPVYSLNELIKSIVELKECISNYEQFVHSICSVDEAEIKNLEASRKHVEEDKKAVEPNEKALVLETLSLGIQAKQQQLNKIKQIKQVKDRILHLEKTFSKLKAGLY